MAHPNNNEENNNNNNRKSKEGKEYAPPTHERAPLGLNASEDMEYDDSRGPTSLNLEQSSKKKKSPPPPVEIEDKMGMGGTPSQTLAPLTSKMGMGGEQLSPGATLPQSTVMNRPDEYVGESPVPDIDKVEAPAATESPKEQEAGAEQATNTREADREVTNNNQENGAEEASDNSDKEEKKEPEEAANFGIVAKIMAELQQQTTRLDGENSIGGPTEGDEALNEAEELTAEEARRRAEEQDNTPNSSGGSASPNNSATGNSGQEGAQSETSAEDAALNSLNVETTAEEQQQDEERAAREAIAFKHGLMVGRSTGYGAQIEKQEDGSLKVTPFGTDQSSISAGLNNYRNQNTEEAQNKDQTEPGYYNAYARGYNEGQSEGIRLKREADQAARQQELTAAQGTPEYQAGAALGMACGAASGKGESQIDAKFVYTKPGESSTTEVEVKGPMAPVRNKAMSEKSTPNGELSGEAFERAFMQHYNAAYGEASSQNRPKGPEIDEDYKAGYDRGYKLGQQKGEGHAGDEDLLAEKRAYNDLPANASKPQKQKKEGFYAGYNRGMSDAHRKAKAAKKAAIKARNSDPTFMAGFATGNMQGFLKAMLVGTNVTVAQAITSEDKLVEGGIPKFFPIPNMVRKYLTLVETHAAVPGAQERQTAIDKATIAKPLFKEGLRIGFNQGYGNAEQNRGNFKRAQYKLHPDYQEAIKPVHTRQYNGGDESLNMGQVMADLRAHSIHIGKKKNPSESELEKKNLYQQAYAKLQAETNKKSEYYQRGVLDYYNHNLPLFEKRYKDEDAQAVLRDPKYLEGRKWGLKVGERIKKGKDDLKKLHRNGHDVRARRKQFNKAVQTMHNNAKKEGELYFNGYARAYSEVLENANKDTSDRAARDNAAAMAYNDAVNDRGRANEIFQEAGLSVNDSVDVQKAQREHAKDAKKAFTDGAAQGYNLFNSSYIFDIKTGRQDQGKISKVGDNYEKHAKSKLTSYKSAKESDESSKYGDGIPLGLLFFFLKGYDYENRENTNATYGSGKGWQDALSFNEGYKQGTNDARTDSTEGKNKIKDFPKSEDAFNAGYNAAKYEQRYASFRTRMIAAVHAQENQAAATNTGSGPIMYTESSDGSTHLSTANHVSGITHRDHTQHAATTTSIADTHALLAIQDNAEEERIKAVAAQEARGENTTPATANRNSADNMAMDNTSANGASDATSAEKTEKHHDPVVNKADGYQEAQNLWKTIVYLYNGITLPDSPNGEEPIIIHMQEENGSNTTDRIANTPENKAKAQHYYNNRAIYIEKIARYYAADYVRKNPQLSSQRLKVEEANNSMENLTSYFLAMMKAYRGAVEEIKAYFTEGYNLSIADIERSYENDFIGSWQHDIGYIRGLKQIAGDRGEVQALQLPNPPVAEMTMDSIDENSTKYKEGHAKGMLFGQKIRSGLATLEGSALADASGDQYESGYREGKTAGEKAGKDYVTSVKADRSSVNKTINDELNTLAGKNKNAADESFKRGFRKGYEEMYWPARDFEHGRELGFNRQREGIADQSEPEIEIRDEVAFFNGFHLGRENAAMGREKTFNGGGQEEDTRTKWEKVRDLVLDVSWLNMSLKAIEEMEVHTVIGSVLNPQNSLFNRFKDLKTIKALQGAAADNQATKEPEDKTSMGGTPQGPSLAEGVLPAPYNFDNIDAFYEISQIKNFYKNPENNNDELTRQERYDYFMMAYDRFSRSVYAQALVELQNLSMLVAMGGGSSAFSGGGLVNSNSTSADGGGSIQGTLDSLRYLLDGSSAQDFTISDLELIDRFYELEYEIESREHSIQQSLKNIEFYKDLTNTTRDDSVTVIQKHIKELEEALENEELSVKERKQKRKELKESKVELRSENRNVAIFQRKWEKAEERTADKIEEIREFMLEALGFDTPLESNDDILEYIKINLETSKSKDPKDFVYNSIDIFNDLELKGEYDYDESNAFQAMVKGSGALRLDEEAEVASASNVQVEISRSGFKFTATGLDHSQYDNTLSLFQGKLVTPKLEGGAHQGKRLEFSFSKFTLNKKDTVKRQIEDQQSVLSGG